MIKTVSNAFIVFGACIMIANIAKFLVVRRRLKEMPQDVFKGRPPCSGVLLTLMAFFLAGYVFVLWSNAAGLNLFGELFVGLIFFFGSIFVLLTVFFQNYTTRLLKEYLDELVQEKGLLTQSHATLERQDVRLREMVQELRTSEGRFRQLAEASFEGIVICTAEEILDVNGSLCRMFREDVSSLLGAQPTDLIHANSREYFLARLVGEDEYPFECQGVRSDGTPLTVEIRRKRIGFSGRDALVVAIRDVSERKEMEERLRHEVMHDPLTGLANRTLCLDRVRQALARSLRRHDYFYAVVFLDLDRFKVINDSLGHALGDRLLCEVSRRIQGQLRDVDTVARFGGDEFILLLEECHPKQAVRIVRRLRDCMKAPFAIEGHSLQINASYGIVLGPVPDVTPEQILQNANLAMHSAKAMGRDRFKVFRTRMLTRAIEVMNLENDIRRGLANGEFMLHYQPVLEITDGDRIAGFEALARWQHPQKGFVSPADFIPLAEETGLIGELGRFVLTEACRQLNVWLAEAPGASVGLRMAVNLSAMQLGQPGIISTVRQVIEETGVPPQNITLELTESAVMDNPAAALHKIQQLKKLGVHISIDDFGTGYSSLAYLEQLPVDTLKIDRSFIARIESQARNSSIVQAVIMLAHSLGLKVVAEGVEERTQLDMLRELGCDAVQGYFYSPPVPADKAGEMLAAPSLLEKGR